MQELHSIRYYFTFATGLVSRMVLRKILATSFVTFNLFSGDGNTLS